MFYGSGGIMKYLRKIFSSRIFKVLIFIFIAVLISITCIFAIVWKKLDLIQYDTETETPTVTSPIVLETVVDVEDDIHIETSEPVVAETEPDVTNYVHNILVIGTDERSIDFSDNARSDCMILVSIDKQNNSVKLVSFERAIGVPILEGDLAGEDDLLTHIFRWGGADLLVKTIEHCFEIDIDHYVRLNFTSVQKLINTIGGIDITLTAAEAGAINEVFHDGNWVVLPGNNRLYGKKALFFARLRKVDSDWKRVGRQRKVILAVVDKLKESSLLTLFDLADEVLPMIQTDLTKEEIVQLVLYAPSFLTSEFDEMTIPKQGTYGDMPIRNNSYGFKVDYEINNDLLYRFLYEGASSEELLAE